MSNSSMTSFCLLSNDVICMLILVGPKTTLPRVFTLPHFPLPWVMKNYIEEIPHTDEV